METDDDLEACRLCANFYVNSSDQNFVHLFKPQESLESQITFVRAMLESWQVQVLPDDGLPQRICVNCYNKFCNVNTLREECIDAQTRLLDAILSQNMNGHTLCINAETSGGLHSFFAEELLEMQNAHMSMQENASLMQTSELEQMQLLNNLTDLLETEATNQEAQAEVPQNVTQNVENNIQNTAEVATPPATVQENMDNFDLEEMLHSNVIHKTPINNHNNANKNGIDNGIHNDNNVDGCYDSPSDECDDEEEIVGRVMTNPLACQYCYCPAACTKDPIPFDNCEALSQHFFDAHDPKRPYNCPKCPRTFQTMRKREDHVRSFHKEKVKKTECQNNNNGNSNMDPTNPPQSNVLQCMYCFEKVPGSMELHEFYCNYVGDWKCKECNVEFIKTALHRFRTHERVHDPNKQIFCRLCNKPYNRLASLATHEQTHFSQKYSCELCNEGFNSEYLLKRHKYNVHDGEMPVHCNICNKSFVSFSFFQRHQNQYHPEKQQSISCTNCSTLFNSALQLRNHLATAKDENGKCVDSPSKVKSSSPPRKRTRCIKTSETHSEEHYAKKCTTKNAHESTPQCEQCELCCNNKNELQEHIDVTHVQTLGLKCALCERNFSNKNLLKEHLVTHAAQLPTTQRSNKEVNQQEIVYNTEVMQEKNVNVTDNDNEENTVNAEILQHPVNYLNMLTMPNLSDNLTEMPALQNDNDKNIMLPMPAFSTLYQTNGAPINDDQYFLSSVIDAESEIII